MEDSGGGRSAEPAMTAAEEEAEMGSAPAEEMMKSLPGEAGSSEEAKRHYCKDCDKSFSCGKAFGGHMSSAHAQANKGVHGKKRDFKNQQKGCSSSLQLPCAVCKKRFKSKKSLYGHMKNHPERPWRGVNPPPEAMVMIDSPTSSSPPRKMIDSCPVLAWQATDKRGRASLKPVIEQGVHLAAHQLLHLLNSNPGKPKAEESESSKSNAGSGLENDFPVQKGKKICELGGEDEKRHAKDGSKKIDLYNEKGNIKLREHEDFSSMEDYSASNNDDGDENNSNFMYDVTVDYPNSTENGFKPQNSMIMACSYEENPTGENGEGTNSEQLEDEKRSDGAKDEIISRNMSKMVSKSGRKGYTGKRFDNHQALRGHRSRQNKFKVCIYNANGKPTYVATNGDVRTDKSEIERAKHKQGGAEEDHNVKMGSRVLNFDLNESPKSE